MCSVSCKVKSLSEIDPEGKYVFLIARLHGDLVLLMAFYVPPPFNSATLSGGFSFMVLHPIHPSDMAG